MNTGQIAGGLLSVFGNAGAGAAKGYNSALTKEEDTDIDKRKQEALSKFNEQLENLRSQNNMEAQKQQQGYETGQKGSGLYKNGKEQTQAQIVARKGKEDGLLNTNDYNKEQDTRAINIYKKTHPEKPIKDTSEEKFVQYLEGKGYNRRDAEAEWYKIKDVNLSKGKAKQTKPNNYSWAKNSLLEHAAETGEVKAGDRIKFDRIARQRAEAIIEAQQIKGKPFTDAEKTDIKRLQQAAIYAEEGGYSQVVKKGFNVYEHKDINGVTDGLFDLFGTPIGLKTVGESSQGGQTSGAASTSTGNGIPTRTKPPTKLETAPKQSTPSITIEELQAMANPQSKIDTPLSAMTGNKTYTEVPSLLTRAQEWMGQTQFPDSETPHTGEGPIEAALRSMNVGEESLQTRKDTADKLRQEYPNLSDEQIADMVLKAKNQSTGILNSNSR